MLTRLVTRTWPVILVMVFVALVAACEGDLAPSPTATAGIETDAATPTATVAAIPTQSPRPTPAPTPVPTPTLTATHTPILLPTPTTAPTPTPIPTVASVEVSPSVAELTVDGSSNLILRADVLDADGGAADVCEGNGTGIDQVIYVVDEDPAVRTVIVSADCPPGDYSIGVNLASADDITIAIASTTLSIVPLDLEALRERMLNRYDANDDGQIDRSEAIAAIEDFFDGSITRKEVLEVIDLYFSAPIAPAPGPCGNVTYDTPVPITGLLGGNKSPSWRSDCAEIAYVKGAGVSVMKRDGEHLRDLYRYEHGGSVAASGASWTAWSPDGTRLALAVENLGSDDPYWARHIWVIEADGSNMVQLTSGPDWDNSPSWSPDGNQIVFHRVFSDGGNQIVTIDVDGSNETPLTAGSTKGRSPSWSPDGATIGYVTEHGQLAL